MSLLEKKIEKVILLVVLSGLKKTQEVASAVTSSSVLSDSSRSFNPDEEIELDEKYRTPDEYIKMFKDLERWHTMPSMQDLVGLTRKLARRANDLLVVECEDRQRNLIEIYMKEVSKQEVELDKMM